MATLYKYQTQGREVTYLDADDAYQPDDIRKHWATTFPELGNCSTETDEKTQTVTHEGEEVEVGRVVTFAKKVGTKGADLQAYRVEGEVFIDGWLRTQISRIVRVRSREAAPEYVLGVLSGEHQDGTLEWFDESEVTVTPVAEDEMLPGFEAA